MSLKFILYSLYCIVLLNHVDSFNILQITSVPSKSHYFMSSGIANGLGEAGHNVTFVTTFEAKKSKEDKFKLVVLHDFIKTLHFGKLFANIIKI